jgi:hypothetical protein
VEVVAQELGPSPALGDRDHVQGHQEPQRLVVRR